jgi:hypothetical protein
MTPCSRKKPGSRVLITFLGGHVGRWQVAGMTALAGAPLATVERLAVVEGVGGEPDRSGWRLRGVVSNLRYTTRPEMGELRARSPALTRPAATQAAMIAIRKTPAWWDLPQDERRAIFEEQSRHTTIGLDYLPAIARRLHHSRDLGEAFDFLTWFEFAPEDTGAFDALLARLRATAEWRFVDREVELRLRRDDGGALANRPAASHL